ncbi:Mor transcription activator family protein [Vibrio parahaemolyticus]|uniref:Mor transcription activator family protein n=1 Tax=Vibrio parahaemolyticus TaxID=670 RepID=UPI002B1FCF30|nr:Mor transcription activator family protein [Vibrio parahaemolyticus]MEA5334813.1 Mor transcription activator family protein [Vibrio parahaemolyticus]
MAVSISWADIAKNEEHIDIALDVLAINPDNEFIFNFFLSKVEEIGLDKREAFKFICLMVSNFGGLQFYLPKDSTYKKLVVYKLIHKEFNGANVKELSKKYSMSTQAIYRIVKACNEADREARKIKESQQ